MYLGQHSAQCMVRHCFNRDLKEKVVKMDGKENLAMMEQKEPMYVCLSVR